MTFTNKLRLLFLVVILFGFTYSATAQEPAYKIVGSEIVKTSTERVKVAPVKTEYTHTIKGVVYPVYKGAKGGYFIKRVSKKTGKEYKQYLKLD